MRTFIFGIVFFLLAACSPAGNAQHPKPSGFAATLELATPVPASIASTAAPISATPASEGVGLQITGPADGATVSSPQVTVAGSAAPGAVVTVNNDILIVGANGLFLHNMTLAQGPNVIEVIASDMSGSQMSADLVVTYLP